MGTRMASVEESRRLGVERPWQASAGVQLGRRSVGGGCVGYGYKVCGGRRGLGLREGPGLLHGNGGEGGREADIQSSDGGGSEVEWCSWQTGARKETGVGPGALTDQALASDWRRERQGRRPSLGGEASMEVLAALHRDGAGQWSVDSGQW